LTKQIDRIIREAIVEAIEKGFRKEARALAIIPRQPLKKLPLQLPLPKTPASSLG
jgi:hypothetical protein